MSPSTSRLFPFTVLFLEVSDFPNPLSFSSDDFFLSDLPFFLVRLRSLSSSESESDVSSSESSLVNSSPLLLSSSESESSRAVSNLSRCKIASAAVSISKMLNGSDRSRTGLRVKIRFSILILRGFGMPCQK